MTLRETVKELGDEYGVKRIVIDRDAEERGRPGTLIKFGTDKRDHTWFFADDNKMTGDEMVAVMRSYMEHDTG